MSDVSVELLIDEMLSSRLCHNADDVADDRLTQSVTQEEYLVWAVNHPALPSDFLRLLTQVILLSPVLQHYHPPRCQISSSSCERLNAIVDDCCVPVVKLIGKDVGGSGDVLDELSHGTSFCLDDTDTPYIYLASTQAFGLQDEGVNNKPCGSPLVGWLSSQSGVHG